MESELEHTEAVFVLEEDISKVDYQHRFSNGDDVIFQLADEIYRCYQQEAKKYSISGDLKTAEIKRNVSNKIHEELGKVYSSALRMIAPSQHPLMHKKTCPTQITNK
ncbi:unnamed protein product [Adineta steineri]|uniref:Uncharacterized protein n=1 Tax=Adineta steineri TaxID=433720 RepID=A0A816E1C9_9BILA|nr:unnamed protein product [Adineta steineri]CAF1641565.1 unnamed protein product [Adineta steineri]